MSGVRCQVKLFFICVSCFFIPALPAGRCVICAYAQEEKPEPIIVNGDVVEYSTDSKEFTATGNAQIDYKGAKLTCHKLIMNTETKDAQAEGNVRFEDKSGVIEGTKMIYNFNNKTGTIIDTEFRSNPYFGIAEKTNKVSDDEFIAFRGYMGTCNYDNPHYRIKSRKMDFFPGDKIKTKDDIFYVGQAPLFYLPQYNHSLRDPLLHVQFLPGSSKDWGKYLLTAWRYNVTEDIRGRIYFDLRERLGVAEGFGVNYTSLGLGKGDFKYYYTQERARRFDEGLPAEFQRYFIRWRHRWALPDNRTNAILEYYKIVDSKRVLHGSQYNILKDYFFREYEKDAQPLTYISLHRPFSHASLDLLMQKRINRWYSQTESLPEIRYNLPNIQINETPFYFENASSYANRNEKGSAPSASWNDVTANNFDMSNKFSLPMKVAFFNMTPSFTAAQAYSDKGTYGSTLQLNFSTGSDLSTKFYRIFNFKTGFLGLDINDLRHIITPTVGFSYGKNSIMPGGEIRIGGGATTRTSSASLNITNKLQTKRKGQKVDIADLRVSSTYAIKPKTGDRRGSNFSDFLFELELRPYAWMRVDADATYNHFLDYFSGANYDVSLDFGKERSVAFGQRYQRKGGNEVTLGVTWRLSPKWLFSFYQRRNKGHSPALKRGLREEEYRFSRDLHCWTVDFTYNQKRGYGETLWLIFRLKAFPELEFEYNKEYHVPKPGSQSNP